MDLIPQDWMIGNTYLKLNFLNGKSILRHYTIPTTCPKGTRKVKDFHKTSTNKEIYFILQSNK